METRVPLLMLHNKKGVHPPVTNVGMGCSTILTVAVKVDMTVRTRNLSSLYEGVFKPPTENLFATSGVARG
jgi:hypothetical protein